MPSDTPVDVFPITHSVFSAQGLVTGLLVDYDLAQVVECRLLQHNQNDTYLVRTLDARYVLRIYQAQGMYTPRRSSDILYEIELLNHLTSRGISVSAPIARRDGQFTRALAAPEGARQAVLLSFLPGSPVAPDRWDTAYVSRLGQAMTALHMAAADFTSPHPRLTLDFEYLFETPLRLARPLLEHRPDDMAYLDQLSHELQARIGELAVGGLRRGICHGDMLGKTNVHVTPDGMISFYDFECCGPGWLAYDIGVFAHALTLLMPVEEAGELLGAFLNGYQERSSLGEADVASIPLFVAARHFWLLGLRTGNWENWGEGEVNDLAIDEWLAFWPAWETRGYLREASNDAS